MWEQMQQWMEQLSQTKDDAVRLDLQAKVAAGLMRAVPRRYRSLLGRFFENDFKSYDPAKGNFKNYVSKVLKKRCEDQRHEDAGSHRKNVVQKDGTTKQEWIDNTSLDVSENEDATTWAEQLADQSIHDPEEMLVAQQTALQLITIILQLPQRLHGQANNPEKINYYRLFFTDGVVSSVYEAGADIYIAHERDLFEAMKLPFLDFFMAEICRSVHEIYKGQLKLYGAMVEGAPMSEPKQPLPNDVYTTYLDKKENRQVKASALSNQRTAYVKFLKEQLC